MFSLDLPTEPYWIDLPLGVRVQVRPLSAEVLAAAQAAATAHLRAMDVRAEDYLQLSIDDIPGLSNLTDPAVRQGLATVATVRGLARYGILAWEGVGGQDGEAAVCTPEAAARLVEHAVMMQAFFDAYTQSIVRMQAEGNGSAPGQNGSSASGATIATDAQSTAGTALVH